jgi:signal peptide peptidase SppA
MIDAFALAAERPWVIQREVLDTLLQIADRGGDIQALQAKVGRPLENARTVTMRDGVAVVPVTGPIFRYANLFTEISGATSTGVLARDIQTALDNPYVRAIVLDLNSPGGEVTGINELGNLIYGARGRKPIVAYGGGTVASGAYWLGSAADEIVIDETAVLGSIGVVMSYMDTTERDSKSGVRRVEIVSSRAPDKRLDPSTDVGRAKVQGLLDALEDTFVSTVARNRNTTTERVVSDFGQGGVRVGKDAIAAGMADRIGSLESVIAELAGNASTPKRKTTMSTNSGQVSVSTTEDLRKALAAGYTADQITVANGSEAALAAARAEGEATGRKATIDAAVAGERGRIAQLQALRRQGFDAEYTAALEGGHSPEAFALSLMKAAQDRGVTLDALRKDAPPAQPHANPADQPKAAGWDVAIKKLGGK